MPPKTLPDTTHIFLYLCILNSEKGKIDFKTVGAAAGLKPSAASMRWVRFKKQIESGFPDGKVTLGSGVSGPSAGATGDGRENGDKNGADADGDGDGVGDGGNEGGGDAMSIGAMTPSPTKKRKAAKEKTAKENGTPKSKGKGKGEGKASAASVATESNMDVGVEDGYGAMAAFVKMEEFDDA
ncbi:hypothetical protein BDV18DRAFT_106830 [Aspergillus unguis]